MSSLIKTTKGYTTENIERSDSGCMIQKKIAKGNDMFASIGSVAAGLVAQVEKARHDRAVREAAAARSVVPGKTSIPIVPRKPRMKPRMTLSLPSRRILFEEGELNEAGTHFYSRHVYEGERVPDDILVPLFPGADEPAAPDAKFQSVRAKK